MSNGTRLTDITGIDVTYLPAGGDQRGQRMHVADQGGSGAQRADAFQRSQRMHDAIARSISRQRWLDAIGATTLDAALAAIDARNERLADPTPLTQAEREWVNATPAKPAPAVSGPF
mgnify:CR=1 FL=1